jgi:hypothetical protein
MNDEEKTADPARTGKTHEWTDRGLCKLCGTSRSEALLLGDRCTFVADPDARKLIDPTADKPAGVVLYEKSEGVSIPDPSNPLAWAIAGAKLYTLAMRRVDVLKAHHKRDDLRYSVRWALNTTGDELHLDLRVTLP